MSEIVAEVEAYPDVEGCETCPLVQHDHGIDVSICTASPDNSILCYRRIGEHAEMGGPAPEWCPLRQGGVLVVAR